MPATTTSPLIQPKKARSIKTKLFQCTGFGACQMVFTRSEHLARHTRKHTGEKPFLCVVPGCTRRFSRFDNMMQHTQTHKATRSKSPSSTVSSNSSTSSLSSNLYEPENTPEFILQQQQQQKCDSSDEEGGPGPAVRKLSVSKLLAASQPPSTQPVLKELHLTQDEFEALQGFGSLKHTPIFIDSFRDLASVVYIEPNPVRDYM
jgi:hypothetical protein